MSRVLVSGYFNPIHKGHLELFNRAKDFAGQDGKLVVIVNNDHQQMLKKNRIFMEEDERVQIVRALRVVDEVVLSIDQDRTVCKTIESIQPPVNVFVNGGDAFSEAIPEKAICDRLGIRLMDGFGSKIQSSTNLTGIKTVS